MRIILEAAHVAVYERIFRRKAGKTIWTKKPDRIRVRPDLYFDLPSTPINSGV
ncbi:MAG: hypothetical protein CPDRYMAC_5784 [uncultured Paraburkholderia sp.]|nr:MAG: hypothetical protein CPDRYMAC_5784 [uncultured Paraburkholderia sp.]